MMILRLIPIICVFIYTTTIYAEPLPGIAPYDEHLEQQLKKTLLAKGKNYKPRTKHLSAEGQAHYTNRLILEDSPYLTQHAHNPVNWFPWGEEAFALAEKESKPVFLSIGYSTCHWCHVMERESFEDKEIAEFLNQHFIAIKVDRERHPDVDEAYMLAVRLVAGRGGWPMSSFLAPDGKPFYGATYIPPDIFIDLLQKIHSTWLKEPELILKQSEELSALVTQIMQNRNDLESFEQNTIQQTADNLLSRLNPHTGGFGEAPKFPNEPALLFLLQVDTRDSNKPLNKDLETTLDLMSQGGIYDQIGGGFHRYATDDIWLIPHFEKMLYNQAQLSQVYLHAYRITGKDNYARIARQTLDYVLTEMTSNEGGFYSATDADSEGVEGKYFVWKPDEIREILSTEDADLAIELFAITERGNFDGRNILHLPVSLREYAVNQHISYKALTYQIDRIRAQLVEVRKQRIPPLRDDKILLAMNGMMISTLTLAADVLDEHRYKDAAIRAGNLLWEKLWHDGSLFRVYLDGRHSISAKLDDYAYFIQALLDLYDIDGDPIWRQRSQTLADLMSSRFYDNTHGGFFMSDTKNALFTNPKSLNDSALPSGNSVAIMALAHLALRSGKLSYSDRANEALKAILPSPGKDIFSSASLYRALDLLVHGEIGKYQYGARGAVKASAEIKEFEGDKILEVKLQLADNWHINAHQSKIENIIPTSVYIDADTPAFQLDNITYPESISRKFSFLETPLEVYEGDITLRGILNTNKNAENTAHRNTLVPVVIQFQACNDQMCLAPEKLILRAAQ
ncbi:MAG: thioredoxin domain-containing protein [Proteobacteria bacterium]|nr:thioredoxin domain-containing protein [Pseudomonadota bacterium]